MSWAEWATKWLSKAATDGPVVAKVYCCHVCPFWQYNGGGHECRAPVKRVPSLDRCQTAAEADKVPRDCPLKWRPFLVVPEVRGERCE